MKKTHGQGGNSRHTSGHRLPTPTYISWAAMHARGTHGRYKSYSERGITVCERWRSFDAFFADMGERPKGTSLERIDNNKGYEPDNCCWATRKEQARNRRSSKLIAYRGETRSLAEWCEILEISYWRTFQRLQKLRWSVERAFEIPRQNTGAMPRRASAEHQP